MENKKQKLLNESKNLTDVETSLTNLDNLNCPEDHDLIKLLFGVIKTKFNMIKNESNRKIKIKLK